MIEIPLNKARFSGDIELLESIQKDENLSSQVGASAFEKRRKTIRKQLLSSAVRVDSRLLPKLYNSFKALKKRAGMVSDLEAYVFEEPTINAFVTAGERHTYVALSSAAINTLSDQELEFVIGHELGHAIFGHIDFQALNMLDSDSLDVRSRMQILAWKRAGEISADRCGLVCCGSIDVAASAMFRTLSGLSTRDLKIAPDDFTEQWDHLMEEVVEGGDEDHWQMTHPFPPLRMKAMMLYWNSDSPLIHRESEPTMTVEKADKEIRHLLATMDPLSRERRDMADPILVEFLLWGGLYIACANGKILKSEIKQLKQVASEKKVMSAIEEGGVSKKYCKEKFSQAIERRHERLKAIEINRILQGMLQIAYADGEIDDLECESFRDLALQLGIDGNASDLVRERFIEEMQGA